MLDMCLQVLRLMQPDLTVPAGSDLEAPLSSEDHHLEDLVLEDRQTSVLEAPLVASGLGVPLLWIWIDSDLVHAGDLLMMALRVDGDREMMDHRQDDGDLMIMDLRTDGDRLEDGLGGAGVHLVSTAGDTMMIEGLDRDTISRPVSWI